MIVEFNGSTYSERVSDFLSRDNFNRHEKFYDIPLLGPNAYHSAQYNHMMANPGLYHKSKNSYYSFLLYDDNSYNMLLYDYILDCGRWDFVAIWHDPEDNFDLDFSDDGIKSDDNKCRYKRHCHFMVRYWYSVYFDRPIKDFNSYMVNHIEPVGDVNTLILYFVHHTDKAVLSGKHIYQWDDLIYTGKFINLVRKLDYREVSKGRVDAYNQLFDYLMLCDSWIDFVGFVFKHPDDEVKKIFRQNQHALRGAYDDLCGRLGRPLK